MSAEDEASESDEGLSKKKKVTFSGLYKDYFKDEICVMSDEESFCEITTSEADSLSSSDDDDAEKLELVLQSAYVCSPNKRKFQNDPVLRNSLLLWDKDFIDSESEGTQVIAIFDT